MADDKIIIPVEADTAKVEKEITNTVKSINSQLSTIKFASLISGFNSIINIASSAKAALSGAFEASIKAATEQEDSIQRLNIALKINGSFTEEASKGFIQLSEEIENSSRFTDEAVLSQIAFLRSTTQLSNEGLTGATKAAVDLAAGLKIDLDSAFKLVGKAANGQVETFARYGVQVKKGATDSETFANALSKINQQFGGQAALDINSFSGALNLLEKSLGNIAEEFGTTVISNEDAKKSLQELTLVFQGVIRTIQASGPEIGKFVSSIAGLFGDFIKGSVAIAGVVGSAFNFISDGIKKITKESNSFTVNGETFNIVDDKAVANIKEATRSVAELGKEVKKGQSGKGLFQADAIDKGIAESFTKLQSSLQTVGKTQLEVLETERKARLKLVSDAVKFGGVSDKEASKTRLAIEKDFQDKKFKLIEENAKKEAQLAQDTLDNQAALLGLLQGKGRAPGQKGDSRAVAGGDAAAIVGLQFANTVTKGAEGAAKALTGAVSVGLSAVLGPLGTTLGPIVGELLETFSKGPEAVRSFIEGFINSIPLIISSIIESLPVFIDALVAGIIELPQKLADSLVESLPEVIGKLVAQLPFIAQRLSISLSAQAPFIAINFARAFIKDGIPAIVKGFLEEIKKGISSLGGILGGGGGIGGALSKVTKVFGFADGGIPRFSGNDNILAGFNANELVVDTSTTDELQKFLASQKNQGAQARQPVVTNVTVPFQIGQDVLARAIFQLNQDGFRTA